MRNVLKSCHDRKQVPAARGGTGLHHQQGCGYYCRLPGGVAGTVHGDYSPNMKRFILLGEGYKGVAELNGGSQAGLVHQENYQPKTDKDNLSFLSRCYEMHFNERPFLNHACYLFLTKTTKERVGDAENFRRSAVGLSCRRR